MKFIVNSSVLYKNLSAIKGVLVSNPVMLVLDNFLFEIKGGFLHITASDLQISTTIQMKIEIEGDEEAETEGNTEEETEGDAEAETEGSTEEEDYEEEIEEYDEEENEEDDDEESEEDIDLTSIATPSKMLLETLANLSDQPIEVSFDRDAESRTYITTLKTKNGVYKLPGECAVDFPIQPKMKNTDSLTLPTEVLSKAIKYTLFAVSVDDLKPSMAGVYFDLDTQSAKFIATDARKLSKFESKNEAIESNVDFIIPRKALNLLNSALRNDEEKIEINYNEHNMNIATGSYNMHCRLIEEKFPEYRNVIPSSFKINITLDRAELLSSLKRLVIYASQTNYQVKFDIKANNVELISEDLDFSNAEAKENLECQHEGDDILIGFSAKIIIDCISAFRSDRLRFKFNNPSDTCMIEPEENEFGEDILMVVMPIILRDNS